MIRGHDFSRAKNIGRLLVSTAFTHSDRFSPLNWHHYRHRRLVSGLSDASGACGSTTTTNAIGRDPKAVVSCDGVGDGREAAHALNGARNARVSATTRF